MITKFLFSPAGALAAAVFYLASIGVAGWYGMGIGKDKCEASWLRTVVASLEEQNKRWGRALDNGRERAERDQSEISALQKQVDEYEKLDSCLVSDDDARRLQDIR